MFNYIKLIFEKIKNKKITDFLIRLFTSIIYVTLIVFSIEKGEKIFRIVMMTFSLICLREFLIISNTDKISIKIASLLFLFSIIFDILFWNQGLYPYVINFILYFMIFSITQLFSKYSNKEKIVHISNLLFGLVYIIIPFVLACYIHMIYGNKMILGIFILTWINDTSSYLIGKKWGSNKVSISISPKKSIEGYLGGLFSCLITGIFFCKVWNDKFWFFLSFIISIFGSVGDLVESIIKRSYNVKNSSSWFPGHGGLLDRLDSFIFVIPIVFTIMISISYFMFYDYS